ncbi:hypothetical protein KP13_03366 [Klebsiella pneumoniae subsp. pneumoniae Kp13]|nr:hypothetical protein KP13_03366 [Klebsiella pneumoniae subsp. pneumoniae Kp13]
MHHRIIMLFLHSARVLLSLRFITIKRGNRVITLIRPDIALLKKALARAIFFFSL